MLRVTVGPTGEELVGALAARLATPLADPLAREHVVVHSRGIERWLSQRLAGHLGGPAGVCANVEFPSPDDVVADALAAAGVDRAAVRAWQPAGLLWRILRLLDGADGAVPDGVAPFADRVAAVGDRRLVPASAIATLLWRYQVHRPEVVLAWADGNPVDGAGGTLPEADRWQPALLQALTTAPSTGADQTTTPLPTYAALVRDAVAAIDDGATLPSGLDRLTLFGFTAVPSTTMAVLAALGRRIDVELLVLHPSRVAWEADLGPTGRLHDGLPVMPGRDHARTAGTSRLLRAWGRDVVELQGLVATVGPDDVHHLDPADPAATTAPTVLRRLQQAIRDDVDPAPTPVPADDSVQLHACAGPARQVQVLRDEILRLMAADPTLEPRDIVVMCPDVETFAPLVMAHLATGPGDDRPDLRVRLADRSLRQTNPILRVVDDLLRLASTRVTASRLLDLVASAPVRRRFGLDEADLEDLAGWVEGTVIRWGMSEADRAAARMPGVADNTVAEGLDRLLLGVAMADEDDRSVGGLTPYDHVEGSSVGTAGRLAELASRLTATLEALRTPRTVAEWADTLAEAADHLTRPPYEEPWQRVELSTVLRDLLPAQATATLSLGEVRDLLAERLRGRPSRANHMTGDLTVCTLVPMRSVPHRVVCLLGMDDEAFPRNPRPHLDDLIARHPRAGDADPRSEDRQLLLDAVMAASDALVVTWTATDERSGAETPPCVPVAELTRVLDAMDADGTLADRLTHGHPMRAHDPKAFTDRPSFDALAADAANAVPAPPGDDGPELLPADVVPRDIGLDRLVLFATDPATWFVRDVLRVWLPDEPEEPDERMPLDLAGLDGWRLGDALLSRGAARDPDRRQQVVDALVGRGYVPPHPLKWGKVTEIADMAADLADLAEALEVPPEQAGHTRAVRLTAGRGEGPQVEVHGVVPGIVGNRIAEVSYSQVSPKRLMRAWVRLLALTAVDPDTAWEALLVGRVQRGRDKVAGAVALTSLGPTAAVRADVAATHLGRLAGLLASAARRPLVLPATTAHAYAECRADGDDAATAAQAAAKTWDRHSMGWAQAADSPAHLLLLGGTVPFDDLLAEPADDGDADLGRDPEPHRFGTLAVTLWSPLLARLREVSA